MLFVDVVNVQDVKQELQMLHLENSIGLFLFGYFCGGKQYLFVSELCNSLISGLNDKPLFGLNSIFNIFTKGDPSSSQLELGPNEGICQLL